jgi:transcriptional regulator with XRE-family HTH domain
VSADESGAPGDEQVDRAEQGAAQLRTALGERVRRLRRARGLTARALAGDAGVTASFISQIENGQVMPSVATLFRIAGGLGTTMGDLFDAVPVPEHQRVLRHAERRTLETAPGLHEQIVSLDATRQLEVVCSEVEPGGGTGPDMNTHGTAVEFIAVLEGELEVRLEDASYRLAAGDTITFSGHVPHGVANPGRRVARIMWASTPASF